MSIDGLQEIVREAQVHYRTAGALAYSVLRQAILTGVLEPGEPLRQDALAEALGVSRIPVRSALFRLESDGLIRLRPHRGAVVSVLTGEQVREIYAIRILLESEAMRQAGLRRRVTGRHEPGHAEVLDYARRRDPDGAVEWLRAHLQRVADELMTLVERG